jgi:hypothetical protein
MGPIIYKYSKKQYEEGGKKYCHDHLIVDPQILS